MIDIYRDDRKKQYIIEINVEEIERAITSADEYNNLICRISKAIFEEIRSTT